MAKCKRNQYEYVLKTDREYIFRKEDAMKMFIKEFNINDGIMYIRDKNDGTICEYKESNKIA